MLALIMFFTFIQTQFRLGSGAFIVPLPVFDTDQVENHSAVEQSGQMSFRDMQDQQPMVATPMVKNTAEPQYATAWTHPVQSTEFLRNHLRYAPLRAEGKSAACGEDSILWSSWRCALLRVKGKLTAKLFGTENGPTANDKRQKKDAGKFLQSAQHTSLTDQYVQDPDYLRSHFVADDHSQDPVPTSKTDLVDDVRKDARRFLQTAPRVAPRVSTLDAAPTAKADQAEAVTTVSTLDATAVTLHLRPIWSKMSTKLLTLPTAISILLILWHMVPGAAAPHEATLRVPPRWSPELEATYSFRNYAQDTLIWCITSDLQPHQQCAAIIQRLGGAARELSRQMTPAEMMNGGVVDGNPVDPVTLLFHGLQERFAPLTEETRLAALTSFMSFQRRPNERINELLTRFETVQATAEHEAGFNMSYEGLSYTILRIVGVSDTQLLQLLQPFNGNFPNTQQHYNMLLSSMRRMGHILENQPGNIAQSLRTSHSSQNTSTFVGIEGGQNTPQASITSSQTAAWDWSGTMWGQPPPAAVSSQEVPQYALLAQHDTEGLSDTDTDTSSDNYADMDFTDTTALPENQRGENLYWAYSASKAKWRRFSHKPTRKVRKFAKRTGGKGKGGKHASTYMATDSVQAYFKGKGKSVGKSSNKGFSKGQRTNPKGPDGQPLKCSIPGCGSIYHFRAKCPLNPANQGHGSAQSHFVDAAGPLDGILQEDVTEQSHMVANADLAAAPVPPPPDPWTSQDPWSGVPPDRRPTPAGQASYNDRPEELWTNYRQNNRQASEGSWWEASSYNSESVSETAQVANTIPLLQLPTAPAPVPAPPVTPTPRPAAETNFSEVANLRLMFSQGPPRPGRYQSTARTEARQNFGALIAPKATAPSMPVRTEATAAPSGDYNQMAEMQQLRMQNRQQRADRAASLAAASAPALETVQVESAAPAAADVADIAPELRVWNGPEYSCSICLEDMVEHDRVCRLRCRHVFHTQCWERMMHASDISTCPICRAEAGITAIWHFIGPRPEPTQGQPNLLDVGNLAGSVQITGLTTPRSVTTDYEFGTPGSELAYPTFPHTAQDAQSWGGTMSIGSEPTTQAASSSSTQSYISNTELTDGRQALLFDPGSWNNLTGTPWARRTAVLASRHKLEAKQTLRDTPLRVSGVGKEAQVCTHDCELPVALKTVDGRKVRGAYTAPTINDHALPALLGLQTLIERRAIMDFTTLQLSFTGPGETRITFSPGTDTFQMFQAPSGHLMLPCCDYDSVREAAKGIDPSDNISLHSETAGPAEVRAREGEDAQARQGEGGSR